MMIQTGIVQTESFSMDYFRFGTGSRTLVILPGLSVQSVMGAAQAVEAAFRSFEDSFTVYLFDRRNELPPSYSIREMARDTAEAFETVGLKDVCLFGASQGGMIAMTIAIEHPELVSKLALGSTTAHMQEDTYRTLDKWVQLAREKDRVGLYLAFGKDVYPPKLYESYREGLAGLAETVTDEDLSRFIILAEGIRGFNVVDELPKIRCPVLAIGVYEDAVVGADATMEIAEKLEFRPDAHLYMYIGYGHAAYDTAPDYRKRLLNFFLS
jgi:pimeloyl-ACP methyl ester carboxylesterase